MQSDDCCQPWFALCRITHPLHVLNFSNLRAPNILEDSSDKVNTRITALVSQLVSSSHWGLNAQRLHTKCRWSRCDATPWESRASCHRKSRWGRKVWVTSTTTGSAKKPSGPGRPLPAQVSSSTPKRTERARAITCIREHIVIQKIYSHLTGRKQQTTWRPVLWCRSSTGIFVVPATMPLHEYKSPFGQHFKLLYIDGAANVTASLAMKMENSHFEITFNLLTDKQVKTKCHFSHLS